MTAEHLRMIDLFAGVGGIRLGFEQAAADLDTKVETVFSSEYDRFAQQTYEANYGEIPHGDITDEAVRAAVPDFDVLLAGFPCQPFSLAGVSKKGSLGRPHGFDDPTQGTLFHEIVTIIDEHQPKAFLLENVKHLRRHDKGRTFQVITESLDRLGYRWDDRVIDAALLVPQHRERVYIMGFRDDLHIEPIFPDIEPEPVALRDILHEHVNVPDHDAEYLRLQVDEKYTLSDKLWQYLQDYAEKHRRRGNGFGYGLADIDGVSRTLSARYHKDGSEILIPQDGRNPRRLTPREAARLQGYPEDFRLPCSDTQSYRQMGNSVAVPVIRVLATAVLAALEHAST